MLEWADGDGDEGDVDRCNEWDDLDAERVRWGAAVAAGLRRALLPARSEQPGDSNGDDLVCRFLPRPRDAPGVVTAMKCILLHIIIQIHLHIRQYIRQYPSLQDEVL